jgi:hypothetical protein
MAFDVKFYSHSRAAPSPSPYGRDAPVFTPQVYESFDVLRRYSRGESPGRRHEFSEPPQSQRAMSPPVPYVRPPLQQPGPSAAALGMGPQRNHLAAFAEERILVAPRVAARPSTTSAAWAAPHDTDEVVAHRPAAHAGHSSTFEDTLSRQPASIHRPSDATTRPLFELQPSAAVPRRLGPATVLLPPFRAKSPPPAAPAPALGAPASSTAHGGTLSPFVPLQPTPQHDRPSIVRTAASVREQLMRSEGDTALEGIALYLKGRYANTEDEDHMPLGTMTADDILSLCQCFHSELTRVVTAFGSSDTPPLQDVPFEPPQTQTAAHAPPGSHRSPPVPVLEATLNHRQDPPPLPNRPPMAPPPENVRSLDASRSDPKPADEGTSGFAPRQRVALSRTASPMPSRSNSVRSRSPANPPKEAPSFAKLRPYLTTGTDLVKYGRNGSPQLRFFRVAQKEFAVSADHTVPMPFLIWGKNAKSAPSGELPLIELREVIRGATNPNFKRNSSHAVVGARNEPVPPQQCFTLVFATRPVDLYAPGVEDFEKWFEFMRLVVQRNRELEIEGREAEANAATARHP